MKRELKSGRKSAEAGAAKLRVANTATAVNHTSYPLTIRVISPSSNRTKRDPIHERQERGHS